MSGNAGRAGLAGVGQAGPRHRPARGL